MTARVEHTWETRAEDSVCLVGRIDRYGGIQLEQMVQAARVVPMSMGNRGEVKIS